MRVFFTLAILAWAGAAAADLYRWVDPESGSVKFSSYPPPWYGDPAQERRSPKVVVLPAGQPASARAPSQQDNLDQANPAADVRGKSAAPIKSSGEDRRKNLLKLLQAGVATLAAAKPGEGGRAFVDLSRNVNEYKAVENVLQTTDPAAEAARRSEWNELAADLESRRGAMLQQIAAIRSPLAGSTPQELQARWRTLGQKLEALGWTDNALKLFDPKGEQARETAQRALVEQLALQWKPLVDANMGRKQ